MKKLAFIALVLTSTLCAAPFEFHTFHTEGEGSNVSFSDDHYAYIWQEVIGNDQTNMVDHHLMRIAPQSTEEELHHLLIKLYVAVREKDKREMRGLMQEIEETAGEGYLWRD